MTLLQVDCHVRFFHMESVDEGECQNERRMLVVAEAMGACEFGQQTRPAASTPALWRELGKRHQNMLAFQSRRKPNSSNAALEPSVEDPMA